ncbi:sporulation protein YjcZ [Paenibacillus elgii]|uniref:Sporulation protein YjcZ n=1 Tax=Paenibacillus elgii TaxID=189691 RepID=A0A2T6G4F6_9BACL|nr:sporulation protein YjcZ [Paenibacillus elgii]PUA39057.1 sporulation protein YjcZ [Paenibacillus elgii]
MSCVKGFSGYTSTTIILVLYILLVIVLRSWW